jgi:transcriptional regulator with XRE-family HTH domain
MFPDSDLELAKLLLLVLYYLSCGDFSGNIVGTLSGTRMKDNQHLRYTEKVSNLLKYARKKSGLSSRALAKLAGTSHSTILAYEGGKKTPSTTTFLRFLHACNFSVDFLLSPRIRGEEDNPRGKELEEVLNLAEQFPAKHETHLQYPNTMLNNSRS